MNANDRHELAAMFTHEVRSAWVANFRTQTALGADHIARGRVLVSGANSAAQVWVGDVLVNVWTTTEDNIRDDEPRGQP